MHFHKVRVGLFKRDLPPVLVSVVWVFRFDDLPFCGNPAFRVVGKLLPGRHRIQIDGTMEKIGIPRNSWWAELPRGA